VKLHDNTRYISLLRSIDLISFIFLSSDTAKQGMQLPQDTRFY